MSRPSRSKTVDYAQFGADSGDSDEDFLGGSSYVHGEIDVENEEDDTYFVPAKERPVRVATRTTHAVIDLVGSDSEDYASTRQVTRKSLAKVCNSAFDLVDLPRTNRTTHLLPRLHRQSLPRSQH